MTRLKFLGILAGAVGATGLMSCKKKSKPSEVDGWNESKNETFQEGLRRFVKENHGKHPYSLQIEGGVVEKFHLTGSGKKVIDRVRWTGTSAFSKRKVIFYRSY